MLKFIRKFTLAAAVVVMLAGCKDCSEDPEPAPPTITLTACKDGEQLDIKTVKEFTEKLQASKWLHRATVIDPSASSPPGITLETTDTKTSRSISSFTANGEI
ncbi:MAG: hypothetical protein EAZ67_09355, partial [Cytophagales bacterium]